MKYYVEEQNTLCLKDKKIDYFCVCEEGIADFYVGYVCVLKNASGVPSYSVRLAVLQQEVAVANTLDEAIAMLAAYYEENPPWWHRKTWQRSEPRAKETNCGALRVAVLTGPGLGAVLR